MIEDYEFNEMENIANNIFVASSSKSILFISLAK